MAPGAGEFERELILRIEPAAPRFVAAQKRVLSRADDELICRIVAACPKDRVMHGGEDLAFIDPAPQMRDRGRVRRIRKLGRTAHIGDLGRRLHGSQRRHDGRGILERGEAVEFRFEPLAVSVREALRLVFGADALARKAKLLRERLQLGGRRGILRVFPDADILDERGPARLAQIGRAGEERHASVELHDEALKEAEAEGVIAREPIEALLGEEEHGVEAVCLHRGLQPLEPLREFGVSEMQSHESCSFSRMGEPSTSLSAILYPFGAASRQSRTPDAGSPFPKELAVAGARWFLLGSRG